MKKHILVVEDEASSQLIFRNILYQNYQLTIAENGAKALEWLGKGNITDLIITDLEMPIMNGFEMIDELERSEKYRALPVIIVSSLDKTEVFDSKRIGRERIFIQKPIFRDKLDQALSQVFNNL